MKVTKNSELFDKIIIKLIPKSRKLKVEKIMLVFTFNKNKVI